MTETISAIILVCSLITSIAAVIAIVRSGVTKAQAQNREQNARIEALEAKVKNFETFFDNDNKRLNAIEQGNRITQQALLSLMSHALDGNDVERLREARDKLQEYLIQK